MERLAWWGTKLYLAFCALTGVATTLIWWLDWHWAIRLVVFLATLVVWAAVLFSQRGRVCGWAYAATLFDGRRDLAEAAHDRIDHVVCATHLDAGEHLYLSGRFAYGARFGWGRPHRLAVHAATQGSTAFPGAFPPRWHSRSRLGFDDHAATDPRR